MSASILENIEACIKGGPFDILASRLGHNRKSLASMNAVILSLGEVKETYIGDIKADKDQTKI